jgi:hypothetical protein
MIERWNIVMAMDLYKAIVCIFQLGGAISSMLT